MTYQVLGQGYGGRLPPILRGLSLDVCSHQL